MRGVFRKMKIKVAITGKSGLGGKIADYLRNFGHYEITQFSSADFSIEYADAVVDKIKDHDVFINLAHLRFKQTELLMGVFEHWKNDPHKLIINFSSRAKYDNISKGYMYAAQKASLNHLANNLTFNSDKQCRMCTLNLGLLEHDLDSLSHDWVVQFIVYIMDLPEWIEMPEVTIQHSANYQEVQSAKEALRDLKSYGNKE